MVDLEEIFQLQTHEPLGNHSACATGLLKQVFSQVATIQNKIGFDFLGAG